jgi:hypothetical protein
VHLFFLIRVNILYIGRMKLPGLGVTELSAALAFLRIAWIGEEQSKFYVLKDQSDCE